MRLFKKVLKWVGISLAVVLFAGVTFIAHSWYFKPVNINIFFARAFLQVALESPEMLSSIHVLEQFGIRVTTLIWMMQARRQATACSRI